MKTIWSYPVKYPYGYSKAYGNTFHTGVDRTVTDRRTDIVVTVNGRGIGIAGTTGLSTGIHTHIGKWSGGNHSNPGNGGATFKSAIVTQVGSDPRNGNFVRVRGDGFDWVYLHLSKITCKVGQKLVAPVAPTYPKWVKVTSKGGAYVRSKPTTASPLAGSRYLPYLTPFRVSGVVKGQSIGGNSTWYKSMYGNYIWSGNAK